MCRLLRLFLCLIILSLGAFQGRLEGAESDPRVQVYLYRPSVFADQRLGAGLSENPSLQNASLWYVRMDEAVRAATTMEGLASWVLHRRVPGLDLSSHRTLTTGDVERFIRVLQMSSAPSAKFRLLKLGGTQTDDALVPALARLFDLQVLLLSDRVSDKGLSFLRSLQQLRVLQVPGTSVTDQSLDILGQLPRLERLSLPGSAIHDQGLFKLAKLPLRQLDLGPQISDEGLKILGTFRRLEQLDVHASRISGNGVRALADLPLLHTLFLGPSFTDADMPVLSHLAHLKRLDLTEAHLTEASASALASLRGLEELSLSGTNVGPAVLEVLSRLPNLRYLDIRHTLITPAAFQSIRGFNSLTVLSFSTTRALKPADVKPLARFPRLHSVIINSHPLGKAMMQVLKKYTVAGLWTLDWLIPSAEAASGDEEAFEEALKVASLPEEKPVFQGMRGLVALHQTESALDDIIPAPTMIEKDTRQDTEANFLGEISVGVISDKKRHSK